MIYEFTIVTTPPWSSQTVDCGLGGAILDNLNYKFNMIVKE
jgi:hypothetical protein